MSLVLPGAENTHGSGEPPREGYGQCELGFAGVPVMEPVPEATAVVTGTRGAPRPPGGVRAVRGGHPSLCFSLCFSASDFVVFLWFFFCSVFFQM